jgi:hypothetical protein
MTKKLNQNPLLRRQGPHEILAVPNEGLAGFGLAGLGSLREK